MCKLKLPIVLPQLLLVKLIRNSFAFVFCFLVNKHAYWTIANYGIAIAHLVRTRTDSIGFYKQYLVVNAIIHLTQATACFV